MAPILGIYASQISGHLTPASSYASIGTVTVGSGGASSITFSSIPSTYTHLQIRGICQIASDPGLNFYWNGDTTHSNYYAHGLLGNGSSASAGNYSSNPFLIYNTSSGSAFGAFVIDLLDYTNTQKYKVSRSLHGNDNNGSGYINLFSGLYKSTSAITSLTIQNEYSNTIAQYSSFALYGVK